MGPKSNRIGVLIRRGKLGPDTQTHGKTEAEVAVRFLQARDPEDCWQQPELGGGEEGSFLEPRMDAQQLVLASRTERIHCLKPPHSC